MMLWNFIKEVFIFKKKDDTKFYRDHIDQLLENAIDKQLHGQLADSESLCKRVLEDQPSNPYALHLFAIIAHQKGLYDTARKFIDMATIEEQNKPTIYNSESKNYESLSNNDIAIKYFEKAIKLNPKYVEVLSNLGNIYFDLELYDKAENCYRRALSNDKDNVNIYINLGSINVKKKNYDKAFEYFNNAIFLSPDFAEAYYNLGATRLELHQYDEAINLFKKAISCNQDFAQAHLNLACTYLLLNKFKEGWREYEWRFEIESENRKREFNQPFWERESLKDKSLLIWFEQGIGDEIMFANLLNTDIIDNKENCFVECEPRLLALFSRSFPEYKLFPRSYPPEPKVKSEKIDYQIPIASLMRWKPNPKDLGRKSPYLFADKKLTTEFKNKYKDNENLIVGISWKSGSAKHSSVRSAPIELWVDILLTSGIQFVNLQYGVDKEEIDKINLELSTSIYHDESVDPFGDLDRLAAQFSAMDLIISVDNATVQLSGALGIKTWTILPISPEYRWGLDRSQCLWHPSMHLFRQKTESDWLNVLGDIKKKLLNHRDGSIQ